MSVKKYRKKPVVIEAMEFNLGISTQKEVRAFCPIANLGLPEAVFDDPSATDFRWFAIPTLEGSMDVSDGDFIIKGVNGEFYPCKPDIFAKTYELENA